MEQKLIILCAVSAILAGGAEPLYGENITYQNSPALPTSNDRPIPLARIILATENAEAATLINLGLQDVLLGYESRARAYFIKALNMEPHAPLALCGLMLLEQSRRIDYSIQLQQLTSIINSADFTATPQELFYIETFLKLLSGDVPGAARDFEQHAERYRADIFSGCWAVSLYHSLDKEESAETLSTALYERKPNHPLCQFFRCFVFESRGRVPQEIIDLSRKCCVTTKHHPMVIHLCGHLLYKEQLYIEAADQFRHEREILQSDITTEDIPAAETFEWHRAGLYEASARLCTTTDKTKVQSFHMELLNARKLEKEIVHAGDILYRWETMTIPMRHLLFRNTAPNTEEVRHAIACSVPHETFLDDDLCHHFSDCLKSVLHIKVLTKQKRTSKVNSTLEKAEQSYQCLRDSRETIAQKGMTYRMCYMRALDCAESALYMARALVYKDSSSLWNERVSESLSRQKQYRMLPPMLRLSE